jgi:hypothetical protein
VNEKQFLKWMAKERKRFYQDLAQQLKGSGINVNSKNAEKLHTVACQTYWRIWIENSNVRGKVYSLSKQGFTLKEFLRYHRYFWNFPSCVQELCKDLRVKMIEAANNCLAEIEASDSDDSEDIKDLILDQLFKKYPTFHDAVIQIEEMRKMNSFSRTFEKRRIKRHAIELVLIPLVWENLLRQFKANPQSFLNVTS